MLKRRLNYPSLILKKYGIFIVQLIFCVLIINPTLAMWEENDALIENSRIVSPKRESSQKTLEIDSTSEVFVNPLVGSNSIESDLTESTLDLEKSFIENYARKYIFNDQVVSESNSRRNVRFFCKTLTSLLGITAGIPFLEAACDAAQGNRFLCVAFATGTGISYGLAATWVGLTLASKLDPISEEEAHFQKNKTSPQRHVTVNLLAVVASITDIYSVYKYNTVKWLAIPSFIVDYTFKSQGYYELFDIMGNLFSKQSTGLEESKSKKIIRYQIIPDLLIDSSHTPEELREDVYSKINSLVNNNLDEETINNLSFVQNVGHREKYRKILQTI